MMRLRTNRSPEEPVPASGLDFPAGFGFVFVSAAAARPQTTKLARNQNQNQIQPDQAPRPEPALQGSDNAPNELLQVTPTDKHSSWTESGSSPTWKPRSSRMGSSQRTSVNLCESTLTCGLQSRFQFLPLIPPPPSPLPHLPPREGTGKGRGRGKLKFKIAKGLHEVTCRCRNGLFDFPTDSTKCKTKLPYLSTKTKPFSPKPRTPINTKTCPRPIPARPPGGWTRGTGVFDRSPGPGRERFCYRCSGFKGPGPMEHVWTPWARRAHSGSPPPCPAHLRG